jgi:small subunit ribosomal protein S17
MAEDETKNETTAAAPSEPVEGLQPSKATAPPVEPASEAGASPGEDAAPEEPAAVEAVAAEPAVAEPAAVEPAAAETVAAKPAVAEPSAVEPSAVEPAAAEPVAAKPAVTEPGVAEPAAEEPAAEEAMSAQGEAAPASSPAQEPPAAPVREKGKRKRLPRALRHTHSKPARERSAERSPIVRTPKPETSIGRRPERRGVVVSDKGDKSIIVKVETTQAHPKYKKVVRRSHRLHAHDERNTAATGDIVRIVESRPLSKTKHWRLVEIVEKAR